jgi:hypothetical protein
MGKISNIKTCANSDTDILKNSAILTVFHYSFRQFVNLPKISYLFRLFLFRLSTFGLLFGKTDRYRVYTILILTSQIIR